MPNDSTPAVGSRWLSRHGRHTGQQVTVTKVGDTSVQVRVIPSTGDNSHAVDKPYHVTRETFMARFVPYGASVTDPTYGGGSYRNGKAAAPAVPRYHGPQHVKPASGVLSLGDSGLNIEVMLITPAQAAAWLQSSTKPNRIVRDRLVQRYAVAMGRGEWRLTGEAIKIDADGHIRDGQHRLQAIIQSQTPITSLVVRGVEESAFDVMDSGAGRTAADIVGLHDIPSRLAMSGAARLLLVYERYGEPDDTESERRAYISTALILAYIQGHPEMTPALALGDKVRHGGDHLQGGISGWTFCFTLFSRLDPEQAAEFAELLSTGAGLNTGHPVLALRRRLFGMRAEQGRYSKSRTARSEFMAIVIKTWNAWRRGEEVQSLRWPRRGRGGALEPFPVPE